MGRISFNDTNVLQVPFLTNTPLPLNQYQLYFGALSSAAISNTSTRVRSVVIYIHLYIVSHYTQILLFVT